MQNNLFRNRNFLLFWSTQYVSSLANALHLLILPLWVYSITSSKVSTGIVSVIELLVLFLFSPMAGVLVDRLNKKKLLIICDIVRGIVIFLLFFIKSASGLWVVYFIAFINSIMTALFFPLTNALIQNVVAKDDLAKANSFMSLSFGTALIFGPIFGAALGDIFGYNITFLINAISFFIGATGSSLVTFTNITNQSRNLFNVFTDIGNSFKIVKANSKIFLILIIQFMVYVCVGANSLLFVLHFTDFQANASDISYYMAAQGIGIIIGSMYFPVFIKKIHNLLILISIFIFFMGVMLMFFISNVPQIPIIGYISLAVFGIFFVSFGISIRVLIQKDMPAEYIGRVSSISRIANQSGSTIAMGIAVLLSKFITPGNIVFYGGMLLIFITIIPLSGVLRFKKQAVDL